mmetsp:Transcript_75988/g.219439  ORF Transcript_75988/g.219439 Transcript_75988/m.219439 type:complete len:207 (-) Transcript_75988:406-1026(-)
MLVPRSKGLPGYMRDARAREDGLACEAGELPRFQHGLRGLHRLELHVPRARLGLRDGQLQPGATRGAKNRSIHRVRLLGFLRLRGALALVCPSCALLHLPGGGVEHVRLLHRHLRLGRHGRLRHRAPHGLEREPRLHAYNQARQGRQGSAGGSYHPLLHPAAAHVHMPLRFDAQPDLVGDHDRAHHLHLRAYLRADLGAGAPLPEP